MNLEQAKAKLAARCEVYGGKLSENGQYFETPTDPDTWGFTIVQRGKLYTIASVPRMKGKVDWHDARSVSIIRKGMKEQG